MQILISFEIVQIEGNDTRYIIRQPGHSINLNYDEVRYVMDWLQSILARNASNNDETKST